MEDGAYKLKATNVEGTNAVLHLEDSAVMVGLKLCSEYGIGSTIRQDSGMNTQASRPKSLAISD